MQDKIIVGQPKTATNTAYASDTTYVFNADVTVTFGPGVDAGSTATNRDLIVNRDITSSDSSGIIIGEGFTEEGGGSLNVAAGSTVSGGTHGILTMGQGQIVDNFGTVTSSGIGLDVQGNHSHVSNEGLIEGGQSGVSIGSYGSRLNNGGTIKSDGSNAVTMIGNGHRLVNDGEIDGIAAGLDVDAGSNVVINHGEISGSIGINAILPDGVVEGRTKFINDGHLNGSSFGYYGNESRDIVRNSGTISGEVRLNNGDDLFDGRHGQVKGVVRGGDGDDRYIIDDGVARLAEAKDQGHDVVRSSVDYRLHANFEDLFLTGKAEANAFGNALENRIEGNRGDNGLFGGLGSDTFIFGSNGGHDLVKDFHASGASHDVIDFSDFAQIQSFEDLKSHASQQGSDIVFDFGAGDMLTLHDGIGMI